MTADAGANQTGQAEVYGDELPKGTELLRGQYKIARFLNSGGFGITYLARDSLDRIVVIKECFPSAMCCRQGASVRVRSKDHAKEFESIVRLFGQEARALAKLDHPNIVGVHQVFEDNHTAYMALDFVRGRDLLDIIDEEPERLNPDRIRSMLRKILEAVEYIHERGILHRDISPDNILLDQNDEPVLIDFGAAREEATRKSRVLSSHHTVKDGYSPQEFYVAGSTQTVASDLYALGATFYHLIAGDPPPVSQTRLAAVAANKKDPYVALSTLTKDYDQYFLAAIDRALEIFPDDRIQSARDWLIAIDQDTRRQAAAEKAESDQFLQKTIRRLVEETNKVVLEARRREPKEKRVVEAAPPPRRQSMFPDLMGPPPPETGNPKDALDLNGGATVARQQVSPTGEADEEIIAQKERPKRLLGRMLNVSLWRTGQSQETHDEAVGKVDR